MRPFQAAGGASPWPAVRCAPTAAVPGPTGAVSAVPTAASLSSSSTGGSSSGRAIDNELRAAALHPQVELASANGTPFTKRVAAMASVLVCARRFCAARRTLCCPCASRRSGAPLRQPGADANLGYRVAGPGQRFVRNRCVSSAGPLARRRELLFENRTSVARRMRAGAAFILQLASYGH